MAVYRILRKNFSRHTPNNLEKYRNVSDEEIKKMTRGQRLRYLEEEDEKAGRNEERYKVKKAMKWGLAGAATLGTLSALASKKSRGSAAFHGALMGGLTGSIIGNARGSEKAKLEGHDRDKITLKNSRRFDDISRKLNQDDDYESFANRMRKDRKTYEMAKNSRDLTLMDIAFR
jgi:hypothetical protein